MGSAPQIVAMGAMDSAFSLGDLAVSLQGGGGKTLELFLRDFGAASRLASFGRNQLTIAGVSGSVRHVEVSEKRRGSKCSSRATVRECWLGRVAQSSCLLGVSRSHNRR